MISFKEVLEGAILNIIDEGCCTGHAVNDYFIYEGIKDIEPKTHIVYKTILNLKDLGYIKEIVTEDSNYEVAYLNLTAIGENYAKKLKEDLVNKSELILKHFKSNSYVATRKFVEEKVINNNPEEIEVIPEEVNIELEAKHEK